MITFNPIASHFQIKPHQVLIERREHWQAVVCHVGIAMETSIIRRLLNLPPRVVESIFLIDEEGKMFRENRKSLCQHFAFRGDVMDQESFTDRLLEYILNWRHASWIHRLFAKQAMPAVLAEEILDLERCFEEAAAEADERFELLAG